MSAAAATFPLVLRRRHVGLAFGAAPSVRRGVGADVAGSRPYRAGDAMRLIDWAASARLSAARNEDAFVVRERFADESPRVVVVADRSPSMRLCPPEFPWLDKTQALRVAATLIGVSTTRGRGAIGLIDHGDGPGDPSWLAPTTAGLWRFEERLAGDAFDAPGDAVEQALAHLTVLRSALPAGTFVFVLSDFLGGAGGDVWAEAVARRWDVIPVVIQDPLWESSFPEVGGVMMPFADGNGGAVRLVRLRRGEARRIRAQHESRRAALEIRFAELGVDAIAVSSSEPEAVLAGFLAWADARLVDRRAGAR